MPFEENIERSEKIYLNKQDPQTTSDRMEQIMEYTAGDRDQKGGFTDFADRFHQKAMSGDSIGAGQQVANTMQNVSNRIAGRTAGDVALDRTIEQNWKQMTSQLRSRYNMINQQLQNYAQTHAQTQPEWEQYLNLKGFPLYKALQLLNHNVKDPDQRRELGLNQQKREIDKNDIQAYRDALQPRWFQMTDYQKGTFNNKFDAYVTYMMQGNQKVYAPNTPL